MKKNILSIIIVWALIPLFEKNGPFLFEYEAVVYPNEIHILKNWNKEELNFYIKLYYKYAGEYDIVLQEDYFNVDKEISINYGIYYYDRSGRTFPKASKENKSFFCVGGASGYGEFVLYAIDAIYSQQIDVLTASILKDTELEEGINKKELSKIVIKLNECEISWEIKEGHIKHLGWGKKESKFKIDKTIEIRVTYEK